ncbi:MAG: sulfur oxidation c-type cytochrome SoxX [Rhodocyclaceae bacterium]|nr:sulfur oxidation c-type cytochrome SoxX [Rhodocyclaceae bacterium]
MKAKLMMGGVLALASTCLFAAGSESVVAARLKTDFHTKGIAKVERLDQDPVQILCSTPDLDSVPQAQQFALEKQQRAEIKYPADGKYLGDWKKGEILAQDGRGNTWSDTPETPIGGNCYNCHRISPQEISFGTIGPSLYQYGKKKGYTEARQKEAYGRIYNSKAFNLCAPMPRFGHVGALTEAQIKDLVALLLDPESPVNK